MQRKITSQQIDEWFDSPVTEHFRLLLETNKELADHEQGEFYVESDAVLTHTVRARLIGQVQIYELLLQSFEEKSFQPLEIEGEIEDERFGDISDGRQGTH